MSNFLLKEAISLITEKLFGAFDIRFFKQLSAKTDPDGQYGALIKYAKDRLPFLGKGSSRTVFALSTGKVLKIAEDWLAAGQNKAEVAMFKKLNGTDAVARIYDFDPDFKWIISEPVRTFRTNFKSTLKQETGLNESFLANIREIMLHMTYIGLDISNITPSSGYEFLLSALLENNDSFGMRNKLEVIHTLKTLPEKGKELISKFVYLTSRGIDDIDRDDHWGITANGRIVVVDYGVGL